jgi:hypothetical protein
MTEIESIEEARVLGYRLAVQELEDVEPSTYAAWATKGQSDTYVQRCVALGRSRDEAAESGLRAIRAFEAGEDWPEVETPPVT